MDVLGDGCARHELIFPMKSTKAKARPMNTFSIDVNCP
jgi:hypothetical protein